MSDQKELTIADIPNVLKVRITSACKTLHEEAIYGSETTINGIRLFPRIFTNKAVFKGNDYLDVHDKCTIVGWQVTSLKKITPKSGVAYYNCHLNMPTYDPNAPDPTFTITGLADDILHEEPAYSATAQVQMHRAKQGQHPAKPAADAETTATA